MNVENFISNQEGATAKIMLHLNDIMLSIPGVTSKIRFNIPFYYRKSWICYLNPLKTGSVEFAFVRGNELANESGLLHSKGRKQVYSVEFGAVSDIGEEVMQVIQEAILLDETVPYASKRSK